MSKARDIANVYQSNGLRGAFVPAPVYKEFTMANGGDYTWASGLPGDVWVSAAVFTSSEDPDNNDHFNIHIGPSSFTGSTWGDTFPGDQLPGTHGIITHLGDNQGVSVGHYGVWSHCIFKNASNGDICFKTGGTSGFGCGVAISVQGYWMEYS